MGADTLGLVPGNIVTATSFLGGVSELHVVEVFEDIKNGKPGFDARASDGTMLWRYCEQVTSVTGWRPLPVEEDGS